MPKRDTLREYRAKRSAESTPEPFGGVAAVGSGIFVVQKHAATRLHYDLRLEMGGVLESWAVPKGVSPDPTEKRLAVKVEDHPLEYADFEGVIPKGNYGAGAVIVWDRGRWVPIEDPEEGLAKGKLLFELRGFKLRGVWTLVKLAKGENDNEWLLIREKKGLDASVSLPELPETSIFSGLTVEELGEGNDRAARLRRKLTKAKATKRQVGVKDIKLMLARTRKAPFTKPGWLFELKLDGYRMLAARQDGSARLITRNGHDATDTFPDLAHPLSFLPFDGLVLDGEVAVHDDSGHPSFQRLQKRARLTRPLDIKPAALSQPAAYWAFDLLAVEGFDLRPLPLEIRKELLREILPEVGPFRYLDHFEEQGEALYEQVTRMGLEGVVAKKSDSRYRGGRSANWLKIRADQTADLAVVGYTEPKGSRVGFGALHLAGYHDGELTYAGRVGTGFSDAELEQIASELSKQRRSEPPCVGPIPKGKGHHWVEPELVAEVRYREWTDEGLLRHPAFLHFRDDKTPKECELPKPDAERRTEPAVDPDRVSAAVPQAQSTAKPKDVKLSNLKKVFWPDEGYTKGDLLDYYRMIAPMLLPYLKNRPLVLTRYPDGIEGKSFYQKDAPVFVPDWVRTEPIWSTDTERDINYFVCDDEETLLYIVNLGTIPLHIWASRVGALEKPDWCILDLDPKEAPFSSVIKVAKVIHELCDDIDLPAFVKTSGSSGLHVLIPLAGSFTYEQSRKLGQLMATVVVSELPDIATITRTIAKRGDKVYIDFLQNRRGQLLVAPYSVRPNPGARVSTPLRWSEVNSGLDIYRYTIKSVPRRVRSMKTDPVLPVLTTKPDLLSALHRLSERLEGPA